MTEPLDLRGLLRVTGVSDDEIEAASIDGTLELFALERLIAPEPALYDIAEAARLGGTEAERIRAYWRALGFPEPLDGDPVFTATDLRMVVHVAQLVTDDLVDTDVSLQMTRVIGASIERIAAAQVDAIGVRREGEVGPLVAAADSDVDPTTEAGPGQAAAGTVSGDHLEAVYASYVEVLEEMPTILGYVWRRHLTDAARRRRMRSLTGAGKVVCVGFADMVGFTATVQELPEVELAEVVGRFEEIAYDVVRAHGGRVVKMIGDEVMFMADDARQGAELALDLAMRYREDEALTDVRVGLASGSVLEKDGDVYGHVVNLASRIVAVAYPGSVVVSDEVRDVLRDDDGFVLRDLRASYLKDIGRTRLWALRRAGDDEEARYRRARDRRSARREVVRERIRGARQRGAGTGEASDEEAAPDDSTDPVVERSRAELLDAVLNGDVALAQLDPTTAEMDAISDIEDHLLEVNEEAVLASLKDELEDPPTEELEALTEVLSADLAQIAEARDAKVTQVDEEAERKMTEVEAEARRRMEEIEQEVEQAVNEAERRVQEARDEAHRKIREAEAQAEQAQRDASRKLEEAEQVAFEKAQRVAEDAERRRQKLAVDAAKRAQRAGRDAIRRWSRERRRRDPGGGRGRGRSLPD